MGLRQAFGRRRGADGESETQRRGRSAVAPQYRHQADPHTGELMRITDAPPTDRAHADPYYTPPPEERRRQRSGVVEPPPPYYGPPPTYGPPPDSDSPAPSPVQAGPAPAPEPSASPPPSLVVPERDPAPRPASPADPDPDPGTRTDPRVTGSLVVGQADRRSAPASMPRFYAPTPKPYDRSEVRRAFDLVADRADRLVRDFYAELFVALGDDAFAMFPSSMVAQREDFGRALVQWVVTDDPDAMSAHLAQLGADHRKFDVVPAHYDIAGQALVNAWKRLLGDDWTAKTEAAVLASYTRLASTMLDGATAAQDEPRSWGATVIAHERMLPDFAVLRLQPDAPYPYKPGQYLTIEIGSHGRQWRQMSIASAPRADNTFDLHVRSVNATGVAAGLVMHTAVGDRVRIGPPRGNDLVITAGSVGNGLLCVCSGTGAAPICAVIESIMTWPDYPPLYAFIGVRTAADMYPVDQLNRVVRAGGHADHIQVHGVVSDDAAYTGLRGRVEDVVPSMKDWAHLGFDVLVAGPNSMMATTIDELMQRGVRRERIHFDQYDETG